MSRRSMLVQAVRRNAKKQTAPQIIVIDTYGGSEPFAVYALNHRKPTPVEMAAAIEQYKRERAAARSTDVIREKSNPDAAHE
jgi:hypothetical protein